MEGRIALAMQALQQAVLRVLEQLLSRTMLLIQLYNDASTDALRDATLGQ
jgi:hypothetical protein